jgi:hypothetical protein
VAVGPPLHGEVEPLEEQPAAKKAAARLAAASAFT